MSFLRILHVDGEAPLDVTADAVGDGVADLERPAHRRGRHPELAARRRPGICAALHPALDLGAGDRDRVAVGAIAPVGQDRDVEHAAGRDRPLLGLEPEAEPRVGVLGRLPDRDRHRGVGGLPVPTVVDVVDEARATAGTRRQRELDRLPIRTDRGRPALAGHGVDGADGQQPTAGGGVVVERVQDGGAARPGAEGVGVRDRRSLVALLLLLLLLLLVGLGRLALEGVPVVEPRGLLGVDVPHRTRRAVVQQDLVAVDPEDEVAGRRAQVHGPRLGVATHGDDHAAPAGPGAVPAVAQPYRGGGSAGEAVREHGGLPTGER